MAIPKSTAPSSVMPSAFLEVNINPASVAANTNLDVDVTAPRAFRIGRPVLVQLKPGQTELTVGLALANAKCVDATGKKIRIRFVNNSAGAIDEADKTYQIFQY